MSEHYLLLFYSQMQFSISIAKDVLEMEVGHKHLEDNGSGDGKYPYAIGYHSNAMSN